MAHNPLDLTEGNVQHHLVRMTIPMFLGISSMIVASMADTIYLGILGARELAAYSFTFPLIMGLTSLSMGLGNGAASIIARAQGSGDRSRVRLVTTHALLLTLLLVSVLCTLTFLLQDRLFSLMGVDPTLWPLVRAYMTVYIFGLPLFTIPMVASTALRAVGNARLPGIIMTVTSGVQILIAPLLIFGLLGAPELGFVGAAWAGVAAGLFRFVPMLALLIMREDMLLFSADAFRGVTTSARDILYIGLPSMASSLIGPFSMGVMIGLLAGHGSEVVAGFGIVSRIEMLVMMILMALSASVGPLVGQNWGARKLDRVHEGIGLSYRFCFIWGVIGFLLLAPFGETIISLVNDDPLLVESAGWYLWLVPLSFGPLGIAMISGSVFIALGRPMPTLIMSLLRMIVIYIPMAWIFNQYWGYIGIFTATLLANVIMGIISWAWARSMLKAAIVKLGDMA